MPTLKTSPDTQHLSRQAFCDVLQEVLQASFVEALVYYRTFIEDMGLSFRDRVMADLLFGRFVQ